MPWLPGDPWPGPYPGGAALEAWGGYVRVYLQAEIAPGKPFRMGQDPNDSLSSGNVMNAASVERGLVGGLWVDLTPDVTEMEITLGSSAGDGILSKAEAGTLTATLYDPTGKYDPLNPSTPYALSGRTRLTPGVSIRAWAEVIVYPLGSGPYNRYEYPLFTGTADRWSESWTNEPSERFAELVATDITKTWARFDKPAVTAVGAGDTPLGRLTRLRTNYGWGGGILQTGTTTRTLQATTMAQAGWELVNRVADDELGLVYFRPKSPSATQDVMMLLTRDVWTAAPPAPSYSIGCGAGLWDIAIDAVPASFDEQLKNAAYVSRSGGTQQTARVQSSIDRWYEQSLNRSDLGLADDTQVATWATTIVTLYAYPQTTLESITLRPDLHTDQWTAWQVLGVTLGVSIVRVLWESAGYTVDVLVRVIGWTHRITTDAWEIEWRTIAASFSGTAATWNLGPHAEDNLDAGYVLA